ncbi:hypothetical protein HanRHA438_Chr04g0200281 [Helianthus annuus]|nr:hypothetical protein HanRHA438_Chr04g0200281 [Helianthus annuus]
MIYGANTFVAGNRGFFPYRPSLHPRFSLFFLFAGLGFGRRRRGVAISVSITVEVPTRSGHASSLAPSVGPATHLVLSRISGSVFVLYVLWDLQLQIWVCFGFHT